MTFKELVFELRLAGVRRAIIIEDMGFPMRLLIITPYGQLAAAMEVVNKITPAWLLVDVRGTYVHKLKKWFTLESR